MSSGLDSGGLEKFENTGVRRTPLDVYDNFDFDSSANRFPKPFASKKEVFGPLSGSEGWTLCSKGESIYSYAFVQCGGALIRNRDTGLITLIHESTWSDAADAALALQRNNDLDVITINGPFGGMRFKNVMYAHEKDPYQTIKNIEDVDINNSRKYRGGNSGKESDVHLFGHKSALLGLSESEVRKAAQEIKGGVIAKGQTNELGEINIPVSNGEGNRWYLLYRPKENVIWIYESGVNKLFKYQGF